MNAKQFGNQNSSGKTSRLGRLVGGALMVAAALAITFVIRNAPPKPAADAAVQGINGYLRAHGADQLESAPDIARCDALEAQHDANQAQAAPDGTIANWRTVHPSV